MEGQSLNSTTPSSIMTSNRTVEEKRTELALDAMIHALSQNPDGDRINRLANLLEHMERPKPLKRILRRSMKASKNIPLPNLKIDRSHIEAYTNAYWRPDTAEEEKPPHRQVVEALSSPESSKPVLLEALRGISSSAEEAADAADASIHASTPLRPTQSLPALTAPAREWSPHDTHRLLDSIMKKTVKETLLSSQMHSNSLVRGSPRRTPSTISRHVWSVSGSLSGREQTIEAVSMMHSPGHVRGYTRELATSPRQHHDYTATPYKRVARMYPGGDHPESDVQAASFMKGLGPVVRTARSPPPRLDRSAPRLCTRFGA